MVSVIRQFHDGIRACMRLDDRVCPERFAAEQGLPQGSMFALLLSRIVFAALSVNRWLQELVRKKRISLYVSSIQLTKAYDPVDRTLLWTVLARFDEPQKMISVIRQFHDGIRACVRLDDGVCSGRFGVEQRLPQWSMLALLLSRIDSAGSIDVASTRVSRRTRT